MNPLKKTSLFWCCLLAISVQCGMAMAQLNSYQEANRLFEQQNFEEALPLFEELLQNNPRSLVFFERYIDSLIGLRDFDKAKEIAEYYSDEGAFPLQASIKLSEIYHLSGDTGMAIQRWLSDAQANSTNIQAIYSIGSSATKRNEYSTAIEIYENAREAAGNENLFLNEMANNYMLAGEFEESVSIYFRLILESPDQMAFVQQRFLRLRDPNLYEIASFELEDVLLELDHTHTAYSSMYQLLVWLLLETEEYNRAYHVARQFETQTPYDIYALFSLGNQLRSARQYELAAQSFEYYTENAGLALHMRALEELGNTYRQWALHASQNQLEDYNHIREITSTAYQYYQDLIINFPAYERREPALISIIDLSLDYFKNMEQAERWFQELQQLDRASQSAYRDYAEGRLALFKDDFTAARQLLTRADRASDESNLSEKARYYISLSDIFAEDYEFAEIQLKSLEQRTTSYYANEAIKLRMWLNNGLRADSSGSQQLPIISRGLKHIHTGAYGEAMSELEPVISDPRNPFADDIVIELKKSVPPEYYPEIFARINSLIEHQPHSPLRERLLWDAVTLAIYFNGGETEIPDAELLPPGFKAPGKPYIEEHSDNILMEFPDGFYAPFIREMLRTQPELSI